MTIGETLKAMWPSSRRTQILIAVVAGAIVGSAVLVESASSDSPPTFGTIPDVVLEQDGPVDADLVSDFVPALDSDGNIAGYVRAEHVLEIDGAEPPNGDIPVVNRDLELVGHMVARRGFVPLGTPLEDVPLKPITVYEMQPDGTVGSTQILD